MNIPSQERGAALLTVLLLVAVIAVLAAHGIDRLAGATKVTANSRELSQAKAYLVAAESIGLRSAEELLALSPMVEDILLSISDEGIHITEKGRLLVRNACMVFDTYLNAPIIKNNAHSYSASADASVNQNTATHRPRFSKAI